MGNLHRQHYDTLEIGRFIAALLVMLFHVTPVAQKVYGDYPFADIFRAGHFGVEYFFVLSGFLMYMIHADHVGQKGSGLEFIRRRAVRILPAYWIVLFTLIVGLTLMPSLDHDHDLTFSKIVRDMFLLSWDEKMILGVSWTLKREMIFYGIFAICLLLPWLRLWPLWIWQASIIVANVLYPEVSGFDRGNEFFSTVNLGFGAGMLIAMFLRSGWLMRADPKVLWDFVIIGVTGLLICSFLEWLWHEGSSHSLTPLGPLTSPLIYTTLSTLIVAGLVGLESQRRINLSGTPAILGRCSYALYLLHAPFLSVSMRILKKIGIEDVALAAVIACVGAVVCSMLFYWMVEGPLLKWLNRVTAPKKSAASDAPAPAAPAVRTTAGRLSIGDRAAAVAAASQAERPYPPRPRKPKRVNDPTQGAAPILLQRGPGGRMILARPLR